MFLFRNIALAVCVIFASSAAQAATVNVSYQNSGSPFGSPNLSTNVHVQSTDRIGWLQAGPFRLMGSNGFGNFVGFCIDLAEPLKNHTTYSTSASSGYGAAVEDAIDRLFNLAYHDLTSVDKGSAFQIALWEIIKDTTGGGYDLGSGSFKLSWAPAGVVNQAKAWLAGLASATTGGFTYTFMKNAGGQDLVTADIAPIPVPAAGGMLLLGLGALGLTRRKKAAV